MGYICIKFQVNSTFEILALEDQLVYCFEQSKSVVVLTGSYTKKLHVSRTNVISHWAKLPKKAVCRSVFL